MKMIDLTQTVTASTPVHPYDDKAQLEQIRDFETDKYTDYRLSCGMHVGTHIDGPRHMIPGGAMLSDFSPTKFVGNGILIDARDKNVIDASCLVGFELIEDSIVLIMTGHSKNWGKTDYFTDHFVMTEDFANVLCKAKVKMIGIDAPSPDKYPFNVHKIFFNNNVLIVENLTNLEKLIDLKNFTVAALPLKVEADSAPARVVALKN